MKPRLSAPDCLPCKTDAGVRFRFRAGQPLQSVAVAGTFNCWVGDSLPLREIEPGLWQTELLIAPGRHLYRYVIDGRDWITDPANAWVSEDGQNNSCFTLDEDDHLLVRDARLGPDSPAPLYRHQAHPSPKWLRDGVIYELAVPAFGGDFKGVRERLPYLAGLGVNILWLMPIHPIGARRRRGTLGDPYAVRDFLAIDPTLGTAADFRALVESAHALGMRVLMDWTLNRASCDNPLIKAHPDWFTHDAAGRPNYLVPNRDDFTGFDFTNKGLRAWLIEAMSHWLREYAIDGFRFDDSDLTPLDFLREIRAALLALRPDIALISQSYDELHHLGACDLSYEGGIREQIARVARGKADARALQTYWEASTYSFPRGALRMRWLEEKERPRAFRYFDSPALHQAAAALILSLDGVPCLLMGQEFNEPNWRDWSSLFEPFALDWQSFDQASFGHYQTLIALRRAHPALRQGRLDFALLAETPSLVRFMREAHGEILRVTVNLAAQPQPLAEAAQAILYAHAPQGEALGPQGLAPYACLIEKLA